VVTDTVGFVAIPYVGSIGFTSNPDRSTTITRTMTNPIPVLDDWAVVADGSIAFVRGHDYHVDWVNTDGTRSSTPKIAHEWVRLSDGEKTAILDSAKAVRDSADRVAAEITAKRDSATKARGGVVGPHATTVFVWPEISDLPDYWPVMNLGTAGNVLRANALSQVGAVTADADNNLWIRQGEPKPRDGSSPVYDIVNRQGILVDRVQLPPSLSLAGFGPGVVYLASREGWGTVIVRYRIR
jgi:hypothetical protein